MAANSRYILTEDPICFFNYFNLKPLNHLIANFFNVLIENPRGPPLQGEK